MVKIKKRERKDKEKEISEQKKILKKSQKGILEKRNKLKINKEYLKDTIAKIAKKEIIKSKNELSNLKLLIKKKETRKTRYFRQKNNYKTNNSNLLSIFNKKICKKDLSKKSSNDETKKDFLNSTFNLEQYSKLQFFIENKKSWCNYLNIDTNQFELLYNRILEISLQKKTSIILLSELISKIGMILNSQKDLKNTENFNEEKFIADIWFLEQFNGYYYDIFKRRSNITNYKKRFVIEKSLELKWKNILDFLGFNKQLRFENIFDYLWFLWYLPKRLIIIWIAKIDMLKSED